MVDPPNDSEFTETVRAESPANSVRMAIYSWSVQVMNVDRIIELEIRQAYQEDLIQALNQVVAGQQIQIGKLEETCKLLHDKIKSLGHAINDGGGAQADERPPHY